MAIQKTIIKFSVENFNTMDIVKKINKNLNLSFDFTEYQTIYKGNLEKGLNLTFFEDVKTKDLFKLQKTLKENLKGFGCFYIDSPSYKGCGNGILFNEPCFVGFEVKQQKEKQVLYNFV